MNVYLTKSQAGFVPADIDSEEWYKKIKHGEVVNADFKKVRNYQFLKKYFALMNIGFDNWTPAEVNSKYGVPEKNSKKFREDTTILAGYFHVVIRLDNSTQIVADSISFANMEEEDFEKLYNQTINVLLKHVYGEEMDREKLDNIVNRYLSFT